MSELERKYQDYIGIDVSKKYLDVCIRSTGEIFREGNDESGIKAIKKRISKYKKSLIVLEATGGYENKVCVNLQEKGFNVAVVNPRQARDFAKALGKLAKTDKIDASVLARFAEAIKPTPKEKPSEKEITLNKKLQRRKQVMSMLTMEKNRLGSADKNTLKYIKKTITFLEKQLADLGKELSQAIEETPSWAAKSELLCSIKGVKTVTATTMIAELPELGIADNKEIAALVGVAPFNRDSGNYQGKRGTWGGRAGPRTALYMATMTAMRFNPPIKAFYEKLRLAGKEKKVAIVACMRKLLLVMNAMLRNNTKWQPDLAQFS